MSPRRSKSLGRDSNVDVLLFENVEFRIRWNKIKLTETTRDRLNFGLSCTVLLQEDKVYVWGCMFSAYPKFTAEGLIKRPNNENIKCYLITRGFSRKKLIFQ